MAQPDSAIRHPSWRQRLHGVVPESLEHRHVLIVGCGSVGSFVASELVRAGIKRLTLIDPDHVEWSNLSRTVYGYRDVGEKKVDALKAYLQRIFPDIDVQAHDLALGRRSEDALKALLVDVDLVIAAVDDPAANGQLDHVCYTSNKRIIFIGLYRGAKGGEIIVVVPGTTPCYHCTTGGVRRIASESGLQQVERPRDYGSNRLMAEVALGSDIHFVCCAAVKIILSLLAEGEAKLAEFVATQLRQASNFIILGMEPDYFLFPSTHEHALGQHAFQSVWAGGHGDPECEVCTPHQSAGPR